jgi:hypothetical protein
MADVFATADDLRNRWPSLPATADDQADQLLADASLYLRTQYPGIGDQADTDSDLAAVLAIVVSNMVKRAMLSITPGVSQESTNTGPYSHSVTYSNPDGNLFLSAAEDAMIRGYQPSALSMPYGC